jgi:ferredoxin
MVPFKSEQMLAVTCSNKDFGKDVKAVCNVGCIGCKACSRVSDLFHVDENISRIDYEQYDPEQMGDLLLAVDKCPMRRIVAIGRPSDADVAAVADEEAPEIAEADFKTTVDRTKWQG